MEEKRKAQQLTQAELAHVVSERAGRSLSQSEVSQIENGRRESHWAVREISRVLGLGAPSDYHEAVVLKGHALAAEAPPDETLLTKLANDELVQLDDWALEQGLTTPDGRANRAAAVRALIHQYIMDEPGAEENRDDDDSLLHHADWPDEVDSLEDSSGGLCIHLLCHNDYGVTEHVDGTFDTRAWRVGERWLRQGTRVAMHAFMTEPSYRQGWLVSYRRDTKRPARFVLTVQAGGESVEWPDPPYGQNPVRIRRS
jgi:transcriptional regulator with XRE-family HTH domain